MQTSVANCSTTHQLVEIVNSTDSMVWYGMDGNIPGCATCEETSVFFGDLNLSKLKWHYLKLYRKLGQSILV